MGYLFVMVSGPLNSVYIVCLLPPSDSPPLITLIRSGEWLVATAEATLVICFLVTYCPYIPLLPLNGYNPSSFSVPHLLYYVRSFLIRGCKLCFLPAYITYGLPATLLVFLLYLVFSTKPQLITRCSVCICLQPE